MSLSSVPSPADVLESFPEIPTKISGQPTYQTLRTLRDVLKTNAASVDTVLGGGTYGHLGLILPPSVYDQIVPPLHPGTHAWVDPVNPGINPAIPANATPDVAADYRANHQELRRVWKLCQHVNAALRKQILSTVDEIYLRAIKQPHTGFSSVPARDMLLYLFRVYGTITPQALADNDRLFRQDWDPTTPFETLIDQIETAQEFATDGLQPYSGQQILTQAYNLVYKTGLFFDDCKEWLKKPPADKTWQNFKTHFLAAQEQMRMQQSAQQTGYYGTILDNHIHQQCLQIEEATRLQCEKIEQATQDMLTAIKTTDNDMSTLTHTTTSHSANASQTQLDRFEEMFNILTKRIDQLEHRPAPSTSSTRPRRQRKDHGGYCWTHGYLVVPSHTSQTCKNKKPGHKDEATRVNNMGGSQFGKPAT